ncbi:hypothetical protein [Parasitella parasitica]|uniref:Membrane anchor Opy2 N-terminal domain-containing protein n=1 Tax=Parasitella parasitica TaxID=35722 RepID=A0A0B7NBM0_9FUNG|nr:hypothetical protein [Parasitella parasitica]
MTTCGVCPAPKCVPRSTIGLPNIEDSQTNNSSSSNAGLIGGLVGGLLSAGLIVSVLVCLFIRRRNKKKSGLPLAIRNKQQSNNSTMKREMQEGASRQVMSGVIPVTFIPPSASNHSSVYAESQASSRINNTENPFNDRPISNAHSILTNTTTTTDYRIRRGSSESNVSRQQTATVAQATQITRAKPQIMRVNTVMVKDGLTRSGSFKKTIQPENTHSLDSTSTMTASKEQRPAAEEENPFDDKNIATTSPNTSHTHSVVGPRDIKPTDSLVSAPGDGEITIFWNSG